MKVLKFKLTGKTAFFKKPDTNSYLYFTYGNIHKVALLGIFGAILGYKGYNQMGKDEVYPEFYRRLEKIKIAVEPNNDKAYISKKVQIFNNSVGYASKEMGGNLIVKEQWLENPSWNIYILIDNEEAENIEDYILNHKVVYTPYLGKNDHYANISDIEIFESCNEVSDITRLNSLCLKSNIELDIIDDEDLFEDDSNEEIFKYQEKLPIALDKDTNMYVMESFVYSNMEVKRINGVTVYKVGEKNIVFY